MGKLETNKRMKENSLLNTAFEFFTTKGFSKTSISDIVAHAGVAKGTFYLYFKDKYDIRNRLICHKSGQLFHTAVTELKSNPDYERMMFEDRLVFIVNHIINQLNENQELLTFISKNLSWGVFKTALTTPIADKDVNFADIYHEMLSDAPYYFKEPEIMLFLIVELVSSSCYSAILFQEPCNLETLKPHLYESIRLIIQAHKAGEKQRPEQEKAC